MSTQRVTRSSSRFDADHGSSNDSRDKSMDIIPGDFVYIIPCPKPAILKCHFCKCTRKSIAAMVKHLKEECLSDEKVVVEHACMKCNRRFSKSAEAEKHYKDCSPVPVCAVNVGPGLDNASYGESLMESMQKIKIDSGLIKEVEGKGFLDDQIVDFSLMLICCAHALKNPKGSVSCVAVSSHLQQLLTAYEEGEVITDQALLRPEWLQVDIILFPIHSQNSMHWSLLIIDNKNRRFYHYDSLGLISHENLATSQCISFAKFVDEKWGEPKFLSYTLEPIHGGQQNDGFNCGVFVILTAENFLSTGSCGSTTDRDYVAWRNGFVRDFHQIVQDRGDSSPNGGKRQPGKQQKSVVTGINKAGKTSVSSQCVQSVTAARSSGCVGQSSVAHRPKVKIIRRIPRASRQTVAKKLTEVIRHTLREKDVKSWQQLFSFAHSCLKIPATNKKERKSLASLLNAQVVAFDGSCMCHSTSDSGKRLNSSQPKVKSVAKVVSEKLSDGDVRGAVRVASSSESIAPFSAATTKALQQKHPPKPSDFRPPPPPTPQQVPTQVTEEDVRAAIKSFPNGSSAGLDGIRPQHLKDLISPQNGQVANELLVEITALMNLVLRGELPDFCVADFFGAGLCAFSKPGGGIRPIAVGVTFRRLAGKLACKVGIASTVDSFLRPHQVGCGVKNGAEGAAHALRKFLVHDPPQTDVTAVLKVDYANAFNTIRRDVVLEVVKDKVPGIYPLVWQSYHDRSNLKYGGDNIFSETGVQQGDPLGPLLFCLGIQRIIDGCGSPFNCWYLDDGTLAGKPDDVLADLRWIKAESSKVGLQLNYNKCELLLCGGSEQQKREIAASFDAVAPGIRLLDNENLVLLGAPILPEATDAVLEKKLSDLKTLTSRLGLLDPHDAFYLLKNCFAIPKLLYFLRAAPCHDSGILQSYDDLLKESLENLLNVSFDERSWDKASLPVRHGGLGIRKAKDVSLPAFISSCHACHSLCEAILGRTGMSPLPGLIDGELKWTRCQEKTETFWNGQAQKISKTDLKSLSAQRCWDDPLCRGMASKLLSTAVSDEERACLLASSAQYSGSWIHALPIPSLGLKLDAASLRIAVSLRLGLEVCKPHVCERCGDEIKGRSYHGLSCRKSAGRLSRHATVNDLICRALISAGVPSRLEPPGMLPSNQKRPDGITLIPWRHGKSLAWDFTCVDTLAPSHLAKSSKCAQNVADEAEDKKAAKYKDLSSTFEFYPICIETLGVWGQGAKKAAREIGAKIGEITGDARATSFLIQTVSLAIQRGNAASIIGSLPDRPDLISLLNDT